MNKFLHILFLTLSIWAVSGCKTAQPFTSERPSSWAQKINLDGFDNLYKVDENLYRSEQPDANGMNELQKLGIKTIVNLRKVRNDKGEARGKRFTLQQIHINTWTISYGEIVQSLKTIIHAEKPVLVHCWHGSDRTGCIIAAYRMANGWTKEEAIKEFRLGSFGYHEKSFPNILELLQSIDIEKLKKDIEGDHHYDPADLKQKKFIGAFTYAEALDGIYSCTFTNASGKKKSFVLDDYINLTASSYVFLDENNSASKKYINQWFEIYYRTRKGYREENTVEIKENPIVEIRLLDK